MRQGRCLKSHRCKGHTAAHESASSRCLDVKRWVGGTKTHQTQYQFYPRASTGLWCFLPVPLYNNASVIITVAEPRGRRERRWKTDNVADNQSIKIKKQSKCKKKRRDSSANQKQEEQWGRERKHLNYNKSAWWNLNTKHDIRPEKWNKNSSKRRQRRHTSLHKAKTP